MRPEKKTFLTKQLIVQNRQLPIREAICCDFVNDIYRIDISFN